MVFPFVTQTAPSASYLCHTTGELGHLDLLLGEVALEAGENHLSLARLQPVNQAATRPAMQIILVYLFQNNSIIILREKMHESLNVTKANCLAKDQIFVSVSIHSNSNLSNINLANSTQYQPNK